MTTTFAPAKIGKGRVVHAGIFVTGGQNAAWTKCVSNFNAAGEGSQGAVVETTGEVTCKRCLKELATEETARATVQKLAELEQAHADAVMEDEARAAADEHGAHLVKWHAADGSRRYCDVRVPMRGVPWRDQQHEGPCYDALKGEWREEPRVTAKQRRAARRAQRAILRRRAPQTRAAAHARRTQRGTARATAKTLLVASGVPQDVAKRYASSFSRGQETRLVSQRIRLGKRNSKRVEVKRYTWEQFTDRLAEYAPQDLLDAGYFEEARERVCGRQVLVWIDEMAQLAYVTA